MKPLQKYHRKRVRELWVKAFWLLLVYPSTGALGASLLLAKGLALPVFLSLAFAGGIHIALAGFELYNTIKRRTF